MHMHTSYALIRKSCQRNWACGCVSTTSCATQILSSSIHTATPSAILSINSVFTASLVLALPESHTASPQSPVLPPSPQKPTLGAKLGALFSLRRPARRHTAPTHSGHTRRALESLAGGVGMVEDPDPTSNNNQSKPTHTVPTSSVPPTTPPTTNDPPSDTMISESHPPYTRSHPDSNPPTKANLKAWWNHFTFTQKAKREGEAFSAYRGAFVAFFTSVFCLLHSPLTCCPLPCYPGPDNAPHPVFGKPLKESLSHASVQISTANSNGELYVWGYIPVVVAKWCARVFPFFYI